MEARVGDKQKIVLQRVSGTGPAVRHARGALIASSLQTLRELGHYERYLQRLPEPLREPVLFAPASSWLPIDLAEAHYQACDALELNDAELLAMGEAVSKRIMGTFLGTLLRTGKTVGAAPTPWLVLSQFHRVLERIFDGGSVLVLECGPKDAIVDVRGLPLFRFRYFRVACLGMFRAGLGLFARSCYARELPARSSREHIGVGLRWV